MFVKTIKIKKKKIIIIIIIIILEKKLFREECLLKFLLVIGIVI